MALAIWLAETAWPENDNSRKISCGMCRCARRWTCSSGSDPEEHVHRRARRHIPQLILRELSFSGQAVSASQIAKAIDYNLEGTQTALTRLEKAGQVLRND